MPKNTPEVSPIQMSDTLLILSERLRVLKSHEKIASSTKNYALELIKTRLCVGRSLKEPKQELTLLSPSQMVDFLRDFFQQVNILSADAFDKSMIRVEISDDYVKDPQIVIKQHAKAPYAIAILVVETEPSEDYQKYFQVLVTVRTRYNHV